MRSLRVVVCGVMSFGLLTWAQPAHAGSALWSASPTTQTSINQAYAAAGGRGGIGLAQDSPQAWGSGCAQGYTGGRSGSAAIVLPSCSPTTASTKTPSPRIIRGEFWQYSLDHGAALIGTPLGDDQLLDEGRWQTFSGGNAGTLDLYQTPEQNQVFMVGGHLRAWYQDHDGPSGMLGWPVSESYEWEGEARQDFQRGSLVWRAETGTRPLVSWSNGTIVTSPTVDPASYLIRELQSLKIASDEDLNRCYGGRSSVQTVTPDTLALTRKKYPTNGEAPRCMSQQEQTARDWAMQQLNTKNSAWSQQLGVYWSGRCEAFVELAYGTRARATSATEHYQWRRNRGQIHTDQNPPAGAVVFYGGSDDGHVGISIGNGSVVSTQGYTGDALPIWQHRVTGLSNPYLGWAHVDGSWPR